MKVLPARRAHKASFRIALVSFKNKGTSGRKRQEIVFLHLQPLYVWGNLMLTERIQLYEGNSMKTQQRILVVSHDPHLADVRKALLEAAGFQVIAASNIKEVQAACQKNPQLAMIGYSLPPAEKRRVWEDIRERCKVPILELHKDEKPSLLADAFFHHSERPDDFLAAVRRLLTEVA